MPSKFKSKYRIKSARLQNWNYGLPGAYFITISVENRICIFGDIDQGKVILNEIGRIANFYWREIPRYFKNVVIDEYIVMPDHLHGVIFIKGNIDGDGINAVCTGKGGIVPVEKNPMVNYSLSTIVRWYKGRIMFEINKAFGKKFQWHSSFYEHIIRDEKDLIRIRQYIENNPIQWVIDKENSNNTETP
jgi:REP element-mobilizing transposase RayT